MRTRLIELLAAMLLTFAGAALALAHEYKLGLLLIDHPYAKATPPNAPVSGGFMTIRNTGSEADRLIGGSAVFSDKLEVHEMAIVDDVMKMRPVEGGLEIPAGGEVVLKPGGYHVMFMHLKEQLKVGEKRNVKLVFEKAGEIEVEFDVEDVKVGHQATGHGSIEPAQ